MGCTHIPEVDSTTSKSEDNPFAGPKSQPTGKVSVSMPTDEWLCSKMGKLNLTITEGYPSRSSEAGGLLKDQFVRPPKSQSKWYHFVPSQKNPDQETGKIVTACTDASKINSTYSRIAKAAGIASTPGTSRQISQDNLRRWEKSVREASTFCNQAAAFNRCLYKVQDSMQSHLKIIKSEVKSSGKVSHSADELQFLLFVTVANTTLARRDSYPSHFKMGIKPDTLAALRTGPVHIPTLFPDAALKQAEQDIANFESKGQVQSGKKGRFHPYERHDKRTDYRKADRPAWKNIGNRSQNKKGKGKASYYTSRPAKGQQSYKWQLLCKQFTGWTAGREQDSNTRKDNKCCKLSCCNRCTFCARALPKERVKSRDSRLSIEQKSQLKYVKVVSCVTQLSCVQPVNNAPNVVQKLPVRARLQNLWQTWLDLGAGPKVIQTLREGYSLPFRTRPKLKDTPRS